MRSSTTKNPTELSIEELLKTLEEDHKSSDTPSLKSNSNDIPSFLLAFQIRPGKDVITKRLFYELYKLWSRTPVTKSKFDYEIAKYLLQHAKGPKLFYLVDKTSLQITEEIQKYVLKHSIDKTKSKHYKKHFELFLKQNNLNKGLYFIPVFVLYYLYDKWVYSTKKKSQLGERQFHNFCRLYFKEKRVSSNRVSWFGLDKTTLFKTIQLDQITRIKKAHERRYGKKTKKKKSKE